MNKNFQKMMKDFKPQIQEALSVQIRIHKRHLYLLHIITKLPKSNAKERKKKTLKQK